MKLSEALALFLAQCHANGRSPHTRAQHERSILWMIRVLGDRDVDAVTPADVAQFLNSDVARRTRFTKLTG